MDGKGRRLAWEEGWGGIEDGKGLGLKAWEVAGGREEEIGLMCDG
jgi:hypothetical protein